MRNLPGVLRLRDGVVTAIAAARPGALELQVSVAGLGAVAALCYPDLVGAPAPGGAVVLNTAALELGLGTGGIALVVHVVQAATGPPGMAQAPGARLVKARYTPHQVCVAGADDHGSPHQGAIEQAARSGLGGMPVVTADLHSALPAIAAGVHVARPAARVAYLMTDGGALPLAASRTVAGLGDRLCGTVTTGQAFGGSVETVTVHSGLLACRAVLGADVVVVAPGPGTAGTGTTWGFAGVAAGEALNAAGILGGRPVGCLRVSGSDPRPRHRGVSHHCLTAYGRVALVAAQIVVPTGLPDGLDGIVAAAAAPLATVHELVTVQTHALHDELLRVHAALPGGLSTMGRDYEQDPAPFLAAAAAGWHAANLLGVSAPGPSPSR
jgi:hypothetical protein